MMIGHISLCFGTNLLQFAQTQSAFPPHFLMNYYALHNFRQLMTRPRFDEGIFGGRGRKKKKARKPNGKSFAGSALFMHA